MNESGVRLANWYAALAMFATLLHSAYAATVRVSLKPLRDRQEAANFTLEDGSGKVIRLSDYRGKVVLLNFWATDCGGCRLELPSFVEIQDALKTKGLAVIGVSMDVSYENLKNAEEAWGRVKPFIRTHGIRYTILMGDDAVTKAYGIQALPATYLIDVRGRVAAIYVGIVDKENLEANIKSLLMHG